MTGKTRRRVLAEVTAAAVGVSTASHASAATVQRKADGRPNIIFILADDLGYADLGCYGQRDFKTPNLDKLASKGLLLTNAYANSSICSPTRVGLALGRYQYRVRVGLEEPVANFVSASGEELHLPDGHPTIASLFKDAGYRTSLIGKWHMGQYPQHSPAHSGYEYYLSFIGGSSDYKSYRLWENDREIEREGYLTDVLSDQALKEVDVAAKSGRPFFMSLHYNAPHWPWEGPADGPQPPANRRQNDGGSIAKYGEMISSMDAGVGRLVAKLRSLGIERNTIVIFTSDNGGERFSDTRPLIGYKGELLEGGIRVPVVMQWPARIRAGGRSDQVTISMDWLPTLLDAIGRKPDPRFPSDGESILDVLTGASAPRPRKLFWRFKASTQAAVRDGDWKYLKLGNREWLFNLAQDQRERANLSRKEAAIFERLKADYAAWNKQMLPYPEGSYSERLETLGGYADRYN